MSTPHVKPLSGPGNLAMALSRALGPGNVHPPFHAFPSKPIQVFVGSTESTQSHPGPSRSHPGPTGSRVQPGPIFLGPTPCLGSLNLRKSVGTTAGANVTDTGKQEPTETITTEKLQCFTLARGGREEVEMALSCARLASE